MHPFIIGLGGDSGSGKGTIGRLLLDVFDEKNLLTISMDAYHKWNRYEMRKQTLTHLNPKANNLRLAEDHLKDLKEGKTIKKVIYDHSTGLFTPPAAVSPKKLIIITGLHPYHRKLMRRLFDLKLFISPDEDVRKKWKVHRDMSKRGYKNKKSVLKILSQRKPDSFGYIHAQEQYADLLLKYFEIGDTDNTKEMELGLSLIFKKRPKYSLQIIKKSLQNKTLRAMLEGKALTLTGTVSKKQIEALAAILIPKSELLKKSPTWHSGMKGIIQLICTLEVLNRL
ncbi:hypothetical protein KJ632_05565 [Patescibacteria group bacterium]|nr:hypothetical protein [Patescibacteria group bacterium]